MSEKIEMDIPIIDAHGHTLDLAFKSNRRLHQALDGQTDVPLMRASGVTAQLTACWAPDAAVGGPHGSEQPLQLMLRMVDYLHRELDGEAGEHAALATSASDIEKAGVNGKIAFVLGLEDGDLLNGDPGVLRKLYRMGLRHLGLVHEGRNALGSATQVWDGPTMRLYDSAIDPPGGLTSAGKEVIREMDRLGILVDVAHMVQASFYDALEVASGPVIVSHANARSLIDTVRYLTDEQIQAVAATGGIVCPSANPLGPGGGSPSLEMLLDNIDYMVTLVGEDYVGFGTDFIDDTDFRPVGLSDISESRKVITALQQRGYSGDAISKIMGGNFMRVFRVVAG